jgi:glycosyltransferase involved in cell wall biosynthesis
LQSDWDKIEVIVIDDGSEGDIAQSLEDLLDDHRLTLIRQNHHGVIAARAAAIEASKGQWIAFLDADDEMTPDRLPRQMEAAQVAGANAIIFCGSEIFHNDKLGTCKGLRRGGPPFNDYTGPVCRLEMSVNTATMLLARQTYDLVGGFDRSYTAVEGHLIVKGLALGCRLWVANVSGYRVHWLEASLRTREPVADIEKLFQLIATEIETAPPDRRALLEDYRSSQMVRKLLQSLYRIDEERIHFLNFARTQKNLRKRDRILITLLRHLPFRPGKSHVTRLFLMLSKMRNYLRRMR